MDVTEMAVTISPISFMWDEEIPRRECNWPLMGLEGNTPALGFDPLRAQSHELHVLSANSSDLPSRANAFLYGAGWCLWICTQLCLFPERHQLCSWDRWREWGQCSLKKAPERSYSTFQYIKEAMRKLERDFL